KYNWVHHDDVVRAAVSAADARRYDRRSRAAKKAAVTRARRHAQRVYQAAMRIARGIGIGEQHNCYICARRLDDPDSIARGIGSECWQEVLRKIEKARAAGGVS